MTAAMRKDRQGPGRRNRRDLCVADRRSELEQLLRDLFEQHWDKITFGPLIQGAAWEIRAPHAPTHIGMLDGYLTVAFGISHFHLCIGPHKGPPNNPAPEALARHRRTARAELYRRLDKSGAPVSWGLRLFNGHDEQQTTFCSRTHSWRPTRQDLKTRLVTPRSLGSTSSALARPDRPRPDRPLRSRVQSRIEKEKDDETARS